MQDIDPGRLLEELSREMDQRTRARRRERELPGFRFRERDQLFHRGDAKARWDYEHDRAVADFRDRREIAAEIVAELRVVRLRNSRTADGSHEQRIAVGRAFRGDVRADRRAAARPVLDHDRLTDTCTQLLADRASDDIYAAAGRKRYDEPDRS
jgi:hypothetical protein